MDRNLKVNLKKGEAVLTTKYTYRLFNNHAKRFVIESDGEGFSAIEQREDGYHYINKLGLEVINERKIGAREVKSIIQSVLLKIR